MAIATSQLAPGRVALFVDAEHVNVQAASDTKLTLGYLGHQVETFEGLSSKEFRKALEGVDVLCIPSHYTVPLGSPSEHYAPSEGVAYVIRDFVQNGGTLVVLNTPLQDSETQFINDVFNTDIVKLNGANTTDTVKTGDTAGTTFADDPTPLLRNFGVEAWLTSSLPPGAKTLFSNEAGASTVVAFQHGRGQVVMLGWNYFYGVPNGTEDGGWLQVLHSAISRTDNLPTGSVINGGAGDDVVSTAQSIIGQPTATALDDIVTLGDGNDDAEGAGGDDWVSGGKGKDRLVGGDGDDVLGGGTEKDTLLGGAGVDDFLFDAKLTKAGLDKLSDFESGVDHLVLSQSVFKKLDEGVLSKKEINKYFDVSGRGKVSYDAGKGSFAFAKIDDDEKLAGGHDIIVVA